jgi:Integron cassette protein VCH_CASS1 chain
MPVAVSDIQTLRTYVRGVLGRAKHHAQNVDEIVLALAGAVIAWKDSAPLQVRSAPGGGLGRALTFTSARHRTYTLSYNHHAQAIDLKDGNFQGPVLHSFSNATPLSSVSSAFAAL